MSDFPRGWEPNPPLTLGELERGRSYGEFILGGVELPARGAIQRAPRVLRQRGESCTGHFGSYGVYGLTGELCSPYPAWLFALIFDQRTQTPVDRGVSAGAFVRALERHGAPPLKDWNPDDPATGWKLLEKPSGAARIRAQRRRLELTPVYGPRVVEQVAAAILRGHPVGVVVGADEQLEHPVNGRVGPRANDTRANHIVTAWNYERDENGEYSFGLLSWGPHWGVNGMAMVHESWIRSSELLLAATSIAPSRAA